MMKKFKVLFAALALVTTFGLVSCDSNDDPQPGTPEQPLPPVVEQPLPENPEVNPL